MRWNFRADVVRCSKPPRLPVAAHPHHLRMGPEHRLAHLISGMAGPEWDSLPTRQIIVTVLPSTPGTTPPKWKEKMKTATEASAEALRARMVDTTLTESLISEPQKLIQHRRIVTLRSA